MKSAFTPQAKIPLSQAVLMLKKEKLLLKKEKVFLKEAVNLGYTIFSISFLRLEISDIGR